ncbi:MAG: DUF3108 domain-containing protein [Thermodesulfobacteriota bacterium]
MNNKPKLTRRSVFKGLVLGGLWYLLSPFLRTALSEESPILSIKPLEKKDSIGETFAGEELKYSISFWWFKKAAEARITFSRKEDGGYLVSIEAETLGLIGFVTRYRKDIYYSHLEEVEGGKRLRSYLFEKEVTIGKRIRRGFVKLDYNNRTMTMKSWGGGKKEVHKENPIPPGIIYDDALAAFFNFRYGAYGSIKEGKRYSIHTFPKKGVSVIKIRIATEEEKKKRLKPIPKGVRYLADVRMDKNLFGSQTGNVEVLFSEDMTTLAGILKDIIFFGDIKGILVKKGRNNKKIGDQ